MENDVSAMRYDPPSGAFDEGGQSSPNCNTASVATASSGSKLFRLLRFAGFRDVELSIQPEVHWAGSPGFAAWIENQIGNIRGAADTLSESGFVSRAGIEHAIADLDALRKRDDASAIFYWNRATGRK